MGDSLKKRLAKQQEELKRKGPGKYLSLKEGTTRVRILPCGKEKEWAQEVVQFYMGLKDNFVVISPQTFGKKCAIMKAYNTLSQSKDENDRKRATKFKPTKKFMIPVLKYKDEKGGEIDEMGPKLLIIAGGIYNNLIELYLDDDNGDFTDPINGYDIKIKRVGKGKNDTEYSVIAGKRGVKIPKQYRKEYDVAAMVQEIIPTYEDTKKIIDEYLNLPPEEDDEEDNKPKKKKKKKVRKDDL